MRTAHRRIVALLVVCLTAAGMVVAPAAPSGAAEGAFLVAQVEPPTPFPPTLVGTQAAERRTVQLVNEGSEPLTLTAIGEDDPTGSFLVDQSCVGRVVMPGPGCIITVNFRPQTDGGSQALLTLEHTGTNAAPVVSVTGTGLAGRLGARLLGDVGFGLVTVGQSSDARAVELKNVGTAAVTIGAVIESDPQDGFVVDHGCAGVVLVVGGTCTATTIRFAPTQPGGSVAFETFDHSGLGDRPAVRVNGFAPAPPAPNQPPSAGDSTVAAIEDTLLTVAAPGIRALANDPDGDALSVAIASPTTHGTITLATDGSFTYLGTPDYVGADAFTYTVDDGRGGTDTGVVTIDVAEAPRTSPTLIAATIGIRISLAGITSTLAPSARLTDAGTGAPLPGRDITFRLPDGTVQCTAVTDATGTAACAPTLAMLLSIVRANGYDATFAGDHDRLPVSGHGTAALVALA